MLIRNGFFNQMIKSPTDKSNPDTGDVAHERTVSWRETKVEI